MNRLTIDGIEELRTLLAERVAQAQCGELVEGSITDVAADALRHADKVDTSPPPYPKHDD